MYYFTITAGRTGSAWLASFLSSNLKTNAEHEFLGINDFGVKMPDIRTMRNFNNFGNNNFVQEFWNRKFSYLPDDVYAETNHTLSKCGLIENIFLHGIEDQTVLIVLKRNIVKQCLSYILRNDFSNITLAWQWYLHPSYKKIIINPKPFMQFGGFGIPIWYCFEMSARQEYYIQKFSHKIAIKTVELESVSTVTGALKFHGMLGLSGECNIPPAKNENRVFPDKELIQKITEIIDKINVNMNELVDGVIKNGFSFDEC